MRDINHILKFAEEKKNYHHARAKISSGDLKEIHIIAACDFAEIERELKQQLRGLEYETKKI